MDDENEIKRGFQADAVDFTDEGLVFICVDEAEAQRAYVLSHIPQVSNQEVVFLASSP